MPNWLPIIEEGAALSRPLLEEAAAVATKLGREAFKQGASEVKTIASSSAKADIGTAARLAQESSSFSRNVTHRGGPVDFGQRSQGGPVEFRDRTITKSQPDISEKIEAPIKTVDGLPPWTSSGFLPPGVYRTNWEDFTARFAFNEHRRAQLLRAEPMISRLKAQGFESIYSTGSFISTKPNPRDMDMLIHTGKLSDSASHVLNDLRGIPHGQQVMNAKRLYGVDLWQGKSAQGANCDHFKFFSLNREDQPVGIVQLMLKGY